MKNYFFLILIIGLSFTSQSQEQQKYFGGTANMQYQSMKPNSGVNVTAIRTFNLKLLPEFGIVNNENAFYGIGLGFSMTRTNNGSSKTTGFFGHAALMHRRMFTDFVIRPFYEVNLEVSVGNQNIDVPIETFSAQLRGGVGLAYSIRPNFLFLATLNLARISYFKDNSNTNFTAGLYNFGSFGFGLIRTF
jgi:hypothetical protein